MEILEEPVMKEEVEDTPEEDPIKHCTKSCYSCGEEGHFSEYCTKESQEYLRDSPTTEVKFDPQEIEALIITEKSRKRKRRQPQNNPTSAKKDLSHITCLTCKESGHYFSSCPKRKPRTQGGYVIMRKPQDLSKVICFCCNEA